jgi:hypothetical protein
MTQSVKHLRSTTTLQPTTLPFGEIACSDLGNGLNVYMGNASNVPTKITPQINIFASGFSANVQTIPVVSRKLDFPIVVSNNGGYWDSVNNSFTPPAGAYKFNWSLDVEITSNPNRFSISLVGMTLFKNGVAMAHQTPALYSKTWYSTTVADVSRSTPSAGLIDFANGTDYYEFWIFRYGDPNNSVIAQTQSFNIQSLPI